MVNASLTWPQKPLQQCLWHGALCLKTQGGLWCGTGQFTGPGEAGGTADAGLAKEFVLGLRNPR